MLIRKPLAVACLVVAPVAWAQESGNVEGEAELGILLTSGNTEETKVNGRLALKHETTMWRNTGEFSSRYTEADDETTAEEYQAALESDYKFDEQQYWFVRGSWEDDRFSGYDFESTLSTGYGNRVWQVGERSFLDLSGGLGYRYNKLEEVNDDGDDAEKEEIVSSLSENRKYDVLRFKGLGEMDAKQLKETTLNPDTRLLLRVDIESQVDAHNTFHQLLGKDASERYRVIMSDASFVDDIDT